MEPDDVLELRKDIKLPGSFLRAGKQLTRAEWLYLYPAMQFQYTADWDEWFINLSEVPETIPVDLKRKVVNEIFSLNHLHSMSYKQAAIDSITEYLKRTSSR